MKVHRFIGEFDFSGGKVMVTDRELTHQMKNVLKLEVNELVSLCDGKGHEIHGRIEAIGPEGITVEINRRIENKNEPKIDVVLYCAILKKDNFDMVVQKVTEVGVRAIVPVITRRTVKLDVNLDRLRKIAKEAAEQSGRGVVPEVLEPMTFHGALKHAAPNNTNYFFDVDAPLFDKGILRMRDMKRVGLFIGTEGGWDVIEVEEAKRNYFHLASLGPLTFRAETAAIIGAYIITAAYL